MLVSVFDRTRANIIIAPLVHDRLVERRARVKKTCGRARLVTERAAESQIATRNAQD